MHAIANALFAASPDIRYVAVYHSGDLQLAERPGLSNTSAAESDKYEELLVNPTVLKLVKQRGDIDCGGMEYVLIRYGHFFQLVHPIADGHLSVGIETTADPLTILALVRSAARQHGIALDGGLGVSAGTFVPDTDAKAIQVSRVTPQLRTTDLAASLDFYIGKLGFVLAFEFEDFYAGVRSGDYVIHFKQVDTPDPSIAYVEHEDHLHLYFDTPDIAQLAQTLKARGVPLVRDVHDTEWRTRECIIKDNAGHTLYFAQRL